MHHITPRALETKSAPIETKEVGGEPDVAKAIADLTTELKAQVDGLKVEVKAAKDEAKAAADRADDLETKLNRPGGARADEPSVEVKAFATYLRKGRDFLDDVSTKALRAANDTAGGYLLAPDELVQEILKNVVDFSPVRQVARVTQIGVAGARIPRRTGRPSGSWVDETEDRSGTEATYGQVTIQTHEVACFTDVSQQLLEDAGFDVQAEVAMDLAEEFARLEADAFINGDGAKKPSGFMADAGVLDVASSTVYARNAAWGMNRKTMAAIRKLKASDGHYLWQDGLAAGQPPSILGRPVVEMPELADIAAGARPIVFGDFNQAYRIFDRVAMAITRDPFTMATKGIVRFHARRRVGGAVVKPEALKAIRIGATL